MREAVFYCEICGKPVPLDADYCSSCGNVFKGVRCPVCSFTGDPKLFLNGCPSCGYLHKDGKRKEKPQGRGRTSDSVRRVPPWFIPVISIGLIVIIVIFVISLLQS